MNRFIKFFSYILRHKWFVFVECYKVGLIWRGIVHDNSKLFPSELFPYANYYYKDKNKYYNSFQKAEKKHKKRNKHHWEHWLIPLKDGNHKATEMPDKYILEMVCDWKGAGKTKGLLDDINCRAWYMKERNKINLHTITKRKVEKLMF